VKRRSRRLAAPKLFPICTGSAPSGGGSLILFGTAFTAREAMRFVGYAGFPLPNVG